MADSIEPNENDKNSETNSPRRVLDQEDPSQELSGQEPKEESPEFSKKKFNPDLKKYSFTEKRALGQLVADMKKECESEVKKKWDSRKRNMVESKPNDHLN